MGLDMYLKGAKFFTSFDGKRPKEDGFEVSQHELELGYWRKHPNLHGYIVQTFADGKDECQDIDLSDKDIETIIQAITEANLPHTTGFFFGESDGSETEEDLRIFNAALAWLKSKEQHAWKSVKYRASW
jgi:hypothetical protein